VSLLSLPSIFESWTGEPLDTARIKFELMAGMRQLYLGKSSIEVNRPRMSPDRTEVVEPCVKFGHKVPRIGNTINVSFQITGIKERYFQAIYKCGAGIVPGAEGAAVVSHDVFSGRDELMIFECASVMDGRFDMATLRGAYPQIDRACAGIEAVYGAGYLKDNIKDFEVVFTKASERLDEYKLSYILESVTDRQTLEQLKTKGYDAAALIGFLSDAAEYERSWARMIYGVINDWCLCPRYALSGAEFSANAINIKMFLKFKSTPPILLRLYLENTSEISRLLSDLKEKVVGDTAGPDELEGFFKKVSGYQCLKTYQDDQELKFKVLGEALAVSMGIDVSWRGQYEDNTHLLDWRISRMLGLSFEDSRGHIPENIAGGILHESDPLEPYKWELRPGEILNTELIGFIRKLRPSEAGLEERNLAKRTARLSLGPSLERFLSDPNDETRKAFMDTCVLFATNDESLRAGLSAAQQCDYYGIAYLEEMFFNQEALLVPISIACKRIKNKPLRDKLREMSGSTEARPCYKEYLLNEIFGGILDLIAAEKRKFQACHSYDSALSLTFRVVKGMPHSLYGYVSDICIKNRPELWSMDRYRLLEFYDKGSGLVMGYAGLIDAWVDGKKTLLIAGINPAQELLIKMDADAFMDEFEKAVEALKLKGGYERALISEPLSDRLRISEIAHERYGESSYCASLKTLFDDLPSAGPAKAPLREQFQNAMWAKEFRSPIKPVKPDLDSRRATGRSRYNVLMSMPGRISGIAETENGAVSARMKKTADIAQILSEKMSLNVQARNVLLYAAQGILSAEILKRYYDIPKEIEIVIAGLANYRQFMTEMEECSGKLSLSQKQMTEALAILVAADTIGSLSDPENMAARGQDVSTLDEIGAVIKEVYERYDGIAVSMGRPDLKLDGQIIERYYALIKKGDKRLLEIITQRQGDTDGLDELRLYEGLSKPLLVSVNARGLVSPMYNIMAYTRSSAGWVGGNDRYDVCGAVAGADNLQNNLYSGPYSVLPVLAERGWESVEDTTGLSDAVIAARIASSVVFVADNEKIERLHARAGGYPEHLLHVPSDEIDYVLCPEDIYEFVKSNMGAFAGKIIKVGYVRKDVELTYPIPSYYGGLNASHVVKNIRVPDYEGALKPLLERMNGRKMWMHGMRLYISHDRLFIDNETEPVIQAAPYFSSCQGYTQRVYEYIGEYSKPERLYINSGRNVQENSWETDFFVRHMDKLRGSFPHDRALFLGGKNGGLPLVVSRALLVGTSGFECVAYDADSYALCLENYVLNGLIGVSYQVKYAGPDYYGESSLDVIVKPWAFSDEEELCGLVSNAADRLTEGGELWYCSTSLTDRKTAEAVGKKRFLATEILAEEKVYLDEINLSGKEAEMVNKNAARLESDERGRYFKIYLARARFDLLAKYMAQDAGRRPLHLDGLDIGKRGYVIRYDAARLSPSQVDVLTGYCAYMNKKYGAKFKIVPCVPAKRAKDQLISMIAYEEDGKVVGRAGIDVQLAEYQADISNYVLKLVDMLNIAFMVSNIHDGTDAREITARYSGALEYVKNIYKEMTGYHLLYESDLCSTDKINEKLRSITIHLGRCHRMDPASIEKYNSAMRSTLVYA